MNIDNLFQVWTGGYLYSFKVGKSLVFRDFVFLNSDVKKQGKVSKFSKLSRTYYTQGFLYELLSESLSSDNLKLCFGCKDFFCPDLVYLK